MGQRLRITFARDGAAKYLSHLELMKAWERSFRRAGWRLAYSKGFNPHPRISFASALPVGIACAADLIDIDLEAPRDAGAALGELAAQLPPGLEVRSVLELTDGDEPVQRVLRAAEYDAECPVSGGREALEPEIVRVLGAISLPRKRAREKDTREYDLRPLIHELRAEDAGLRGALVRMKLRADASGGGRADEVLRELGLDPADCRITRTRLVLA